MCLSGRYSRCAAIIIGTIILHIFVIERLKMNKLRERYDLSKFRTKLFDMVEQWAVEYDSEIKIVQNDGPEINLAMWTLSYNWAK